MLSVLSEFESIVEGGDGDKTGMTEKIGLAWLKSIPAS